MKNDICGVYMIRSKIDNKIYIGSSCRVYYRFHEHKRRLRRGAHTNNHLQNAWDMYGESNFEFLVMDTVSNRDELFKWEQLWLDTTNCTDRRYGYNSHLYADVSSPGAHHSEETRKKLSDIMTGRKHTEDTKRKIAEASRGKRHTEESKLLLSKKHKGKKMSDEARKKMSENQKGFNAHNTKVTPEIVIKIKELIAEGYTYKCIASQFNITDRTVSDIKRGIRWKDVV